MPESTGYIALTESAALIAWPGLQGYALTGPDADTWLQGQITNDMTRLGDEGCLDACLVKATGQLQSILRVWRHDGGLLVVAEGGGALVERFEQFVILEEVALTELGVVTTIQGPKSGSLIDVGQGLVVPSNRTGTEGFDVIGDMTQVRRQQGRVTVDADWDEVQAVTLEREIPLYGLDTDDKTLPPELGADFDGAFVAYDKGCYTGQEVLQRIHSRGHTNREWKVLRLSGPTRPGAEVKAKDGTKLGLVTRHAHSPKMGDLAGAVLRKEGSSVGSRVLVGDVHGHVGLG